MNEQTRAFVERFSASSPQNRLPVEYGGGRVFSKPLIGVSRADDHIFERFKEVIAPLHLTPAEMWVHSGLCDARRPSERLRVVSIVFPYANRIREAGEKNDGDLPPEIYCIARNYANPFIDSVLRQLTHFFGEQGFQATAGARSEVYQILLREDPFRIYSNWSERHVAFAAGLGTFSLHEGFISDVGCNIRLASVITDAPLEVTLRRSDEPYANCLHLSGGACGRCMDKCPANAISENGHDKHRCYLYGRRVAREMRRRPLNAMLKPHRRRINGEDSVAYPVGCALCQFGVPCTDRNPVAVA